MGRTGVAPGTEWRGFSVSLAPCEVRGAALGNWGATRASLCQEGGQLGALEEHSTAQHGQGKAVAVNVKGKALTAIQLP